MRPINYLFTEIAREALASAPPATTTTVLAALKEIRLALLHHRHWVPATPDPLVGVAEAAIAGAEAASSLPAETATAVLPLFTEIARKHLLIETLEERHRDSLDFHDVNVVCVRDALLAAYRAGAEAARACGAATARAKAPGVMPDPAEIDVHALVAARRQVASIWSIEDVQSVRSGLTDDQAWGVLQRVRKCHDATIGINWEVLKIHADMLDDDAPGSDEAPAPERP
jgi:hypothetical protein